MSYTLDSNILIGLSRSYPRDIFPSIWESVEESIERRETCICQAVLHEIERGGDKLPEWAKSLPNFVCKATDTEFDTVKQIAIRHPEWVQGQRMRPTHS